MARVRLLLSYVGTRYSGWQIQDRPGGPPTIQGELEKVVQRVTGRVIRLHGAGRTDAGVHADGQCAHFDVPASLVQWDWRRIFNACLPRDICVQQAEVVPESFHSRYSALGKSYTYQLWRDTRRIPPRLRPFVWECGKLDVARLAEALPCLEGCYDCAVFQNRGTEILDTVRHIWRLELLPAPATDGCLAVSEYEGLVRLRVTAEGFLKQMVRNMVGLLVQTGKGKLDAAALPDLLASGERRRAPATAPAQGLSLTRVWYDKAELAAFLKRTAKCPG